MAIQVLVHEPDDLFDAQQTGISVGPGTVANIEITKVQVRL